MEDTLKQYIRDGFTHLSDSSTYEIISEQEALERDEELRINIRKWILKHAIDLPQNVRHFLRSKLDATKAGPFGYFYLIIQHSQRLQSRRQPISKTLLGLQRF